MISLDFWKNKKILVTGHTGFKGSWLSVWLKMMNAEISGYALEPYTDRDNFVVTDLHDKIGHVIGDVRDFEKLSGIFSEHNPEFVFHLAAQPLVRESYLNPKETYDINIGGTVNVLECCRMIDSVKVIVNITTDKCYENNEQTCGYKEDDRLGGYDPYSSSKACSEIVTGACRSSFFHPEEFEKHGKSLATARAGNVIGGGDWQADRLIPDCIRALEINNPVVVRNPGAIRPWQHVLEPLSGYLFLAKEMFENPGRFCEAWNFGPEEESTKSVGRIVDLVVECWGKGSRQDRLDKNAPHEANILKLDITKAKTLLGWAPAWNIEQSIKATVDWYKSYRMDNMYQFCCQQIESYVDNISR